MTTLDLGNLTEGKVMNLTGHERGIAAREKFDLDHHDKSGEVIKITAPDNLQVITSSFFQGMFSKSIRSLGGRKEFFAVYHFNINPNLIEQVEWGIDRVMTPRTDVFNQ